MSKFRHPNTNQRYTKQLFHDHVTNMPLDMRTFSPLYTLHHDVKGYINFRKEYVKDEDPTGYKTASRLLEDYSHWQLLMGTQWFKDAKKIWDEELDAKLEARAMDAMKALMVDTDNKPAERIAAAKIILGKTGVKQPQTSPRGRPSKEEVQGNLKQETAAERTLQEDLARIGLIRKNDA